MKTLKLQPNKALESLAQVSRLVQGMSYVELNNLCDGYDICNTLVWALTSVLTCTLTLKTAAPLVEMLKADKNMLKVVKPVLYTMN